MLITEFNVVGQNVRISVDGGFWDEIPYLIAFDFRLNKGSEVDDSLLVNVKQKADEKNAFDYAVKYLSRYSVTAKRLKQKLYEKEYNKSVVENVAAKLLDLKYLDDYAFAENLVASKSKKLGKRRLKSELLNKGVGSDIIDEVLETLDNDDMFYTAMTVAEKWYRSHELVTIQDSQKFFRFMAYRGFDYDLINRCREVLKFGKDD